MGPFVGGAPRGETHIVTIVTAVEHGRSTFANIRRFLTYHLADNVAKLAPFIVWALSGGRFPLAIGRISDYRP